MSDPLDILILGGTVVSSEGRRRADVGIRAGQIVACGDLGAVAARERIDADGLLVLPGAIDEHVHPVYLDDPGHCSVVGLHGGVTTLMHFAYAYPGESLLAAVSALRERASRGSLTDFTIHAAMFDVPRQAHEIPQVVASGVRTFKVFLAYAAEGWMTGDAEIAGLLRTVDDAGGLLMVHCENGPAIALLEADAREGRLQGDAAAVLAATRPPVLEAEAVYRIAAISEALDARVFIVHVTSARALEAVCSARGLGRTLVAETCPQYLVLTEEEVRRRGSLAKIGPPLRTSADCDALWSGIADGSLQTVGSDHVPKKRPGEEPASMLDAGFGAPSLETMLAVLFDAGVAGGRITVERLVALTSEHPARVFGLWPRKGRVGEGADADLIVWDPGATRTLGAAAEHTNAGYSLYEGRRVTGAAHAVIAGGRVRVLDGELRDATVSGRFLPTGPFDMTVGGLTPASRRAA